MSFSVKSYAAFDESGPLKPHTLERRAVHDDDVVIAISYTGICHSDLHTAHNDWGNAQFPVVPGHELVGVVEKVGSKVSKHKVGDVVAVGCMVDSCGECESCKASYEMFCFKGAEQTYNWPEHRFEGHMTAGGYSEKIVVAEHFVLKVPKALQTADLLPGVAPILCAGITTYSPLRQYKIGKGSKVGVAGLGGLGHMAVKLATALGAEVTVLSRSHAKDAHAKELGAKHVIASSSEDEMEKSAMSLDLILDTIPFDHDIGPYTTLLKPFSTLVVLGYIGVMKSPLNTFNLVAGGKKVSGSAIGGIAETQELLDLCADQKIIADFKLIAMEDVNQAWTDMANGDVSKRMIIDIKKFAGK